GKSTLANVLIQEDLNPDSSKNAFPIGDSAVGVTSEVKFNHNHTFEVYNTIGLCEASKGTISNKEAVKKIRCFFSKTETLLNYICYVKKKGNDNVKTIRDYFGNYPIIAVDFPSDDRFDANVQEEIRKESREHLISSLKYLRYKCVKLEILEPKEYFESKVKGVISFVPIVGTTYNLISSGVYSILKKPKLAKRRLVEGVSGLSKVLSSVAMKLLTNS
ncbi:2570_t:CDS:2, partial [Cetraspora pellucida]